MASNPYHYLYINLHGWSVKVNGEDFYNHYAASVMISLIIVINLGTVFSLASIVDVWDWLRSLINEEVVIVCSLLIFCSNYLYFSYGERGQRLVDDSVVLGGGHMRPGLVTGCVVFGSLSGLFLTWSIGLIYG